MRIETEKARERQEEGVDLSEKSNEGGRADDKTAKAFGVSATTMRKEIEPCADSRRLRAVCIPFLRLLQLWISPISYHLEFRDLDCYSVLPSGYSTESRQSLPRQLSVRLQLPVPLGMSVLVPCCSFAFSASTGLSFNARTLLQSLI